ncbi:MAG: acetate--CoA ligase family protein [Thermoplasmata archaeon]|nr:acetate--CoA ligase family protein [Thermoplasmata archaeon]
MLAEHEAKTLVSRYGIDVPRFRVVEREEDLENIDLRYPLVLKVSSPNILHKTDVGGVILNITSKEMLLSSFRSLKEKFPDEKFMVEEMETRGVEIIAGIIDDDAFGKCIMVGMGGIFTEIYRDVAFRMIPINEEDAEEMLAELKAGKIFSGYRMNLNRDDVINMLMKMARMAEEMRIKQMDLNPVIVSESGIKAVDAKIIMEE